MKNLTNNLKKKTQVSTSRIFIVNIIIIIINLYTTINHRRNIDILDDNDYASL